MVLFCHLQPKASKDEFAGLHGERLKIRITAPPIDGKANRHLTKFLAKQFGVGQRQIIISSGETGRKKTIQITNPTSFPDSLEIKY